MRVGKVLSSEQKLVFVFYCNITSISKDINKWVRTFVMDACVGFLRSRMTDQKRRFYPNEDLSLARIVYPFPLASKE